LDNPKDHQKVEDRKGKFAFFDPLLCYIILEAQKELRFEPELAIFASFSQKFEANMIGMNFWKLFLPSSSLPCSILAFIYSKK
jgi:hypothetical protein